MKENIKHIITYIAIAVLFFIAGSFLAPSGKIVQGLKKSMAYTVGKSQKLYSNWDIDKLYFVDDKKPFNSVVSSESTFIVYFWASWCPHCENVYPIMNSLSSLNVPFVAMTFDTEMEKYKDYISTKKPLWSDIMFLSSEGDIEFVSRKEAYAIPSIPSVWIIKNGKVQKIFKGEKGIAKLPAYLKKVSLL